MCIFDFQFQVRGGKIRQPARVVEIRDYGHYFRRDVLAEACRFFHRPAHIAHQCFNLERSLRRQHSGITCNFASRNSPAEFTDLSGRATALDEDANAPVGQLQHSHNYGHGSDLMEIVLLRFFFQILLTGEQDHPMLTERFVDGPNRSVTRTNSGTT